MIAKPVSYWPEPFAAKIVLVIQRITVAVIKLIIFKQNLLAKSITMYPSLITVILLLNLSGETAQPETGANFEPLAQSFYPAADDDRPELFLPEEGDSDPSNFEPVQGDSDPDNFESPDLDELALPTRSSDRAQA